MTGKGRYLIGVLFLCAMFVLVFGTVAIGRAAAADADSALAAATEDTEPPYLAPPGAVAAESDAADPSYPAQVYTGRAPGTAPLGPDSISSIAGSTIETTDCYDAGATRTMCFVVTNGSTDSEWIDQVRLTFPTLLGAWTVACNSQDATDSSGNPVGLTCSASGNEVTYNDTDIETPVSVGEVTSGSTWGFCVDVTVPSPCNGPRYVQWGLSGDEASGSTTPHDITGSIGIEMCTPVMLSPSGAVIEGCNGVAATQVFQLWNHTGSAGTFNLNYSVPSGNASFSGPSGAWLNADDTITFTVSLTPDLCLAAGDTVTASLTAEDNGNSDTSTLVETITEFGGFQQQAPSPISTMDNVVAWAMHDGGLWSIGGYGAPGQTQRYDPTSGLWTTHTAHTSPTIEYPMDGCYGLDGDGHEVIVLFPDTIITGTLAQYDITDDAWTDLPIPPGYPPEGRWAHDVTSMYAVAGQNICYLSGGSTEEGGGRTRDLWSYNPATNITIYLGHFAQVLPAFDFHASWFVPWVGKDGAICVAGGADISSVGLSATQCYDLHTASFNAPNADLGPLPETWWGMADGWKIHKGRYQIWLSNGVGSDGALIGKSAYADATTGGFVYGPDPAVDVYRGEGDGWEGHFYAEQGAAGGFNHTTYNQKLVQCPRCFQWDKTVNGIPWTPGMTVTAELSDTIQVTDVFTTEEYFDLVETWHADRLHLVDWNLSPLFASDLISGPGELAWAFNEPHPFVFAATKWLHVEPCMWANVMVNETVLIGDEMIDEKPFVVHKTPPELWIDSFFDVVVEPGQPATFTLVYGNSGGYESNVVITNTFPSEAPFLQSNPPPDDVDPGGAWARWRLGDLATGSQGAITVTVSVASTIPATDPTVIWDGIFNHAGVLQDETTITYYIGGHQVYLPLVLRFY